MTRRNLCPLMSVLVATFVMSGSTLGQDVGGAVAPDEPMSPTTG